MEAFEEEPLVEDLPEPKSSEETYEVRRTDVLYMPKSSYEKLKLHHDSDVSRVDTKEIIVENRFNLYTNERFNSIEKLNKFLVYHGKIPEYLFVSKSDVHGYGVFSKCAIKKDKFLGEYQCIVRPAYQTNHNYFMIISGEGQDPLMYDSSNILYANWTRFINHSKDSNVEFKFENYVIRVYATKTILPGEEIFNNFGDKYCQET